MHFYEFCFCATNVLVQQKNGGAMAHHPLVAWALSHNHEAVKWGIVVPGSSHITSNLEDNLPSTFVPISGG